MYCSMFWGLLERAYDYLFKSSLIFKFGCVVAEISSFKEGKSFGFCYKMNQNASKSLKMLQNRLDIGISHL